MTNFGAKILNNATSALAAQQAVIATLGNNIANVNTAGYARTVVDLQTKVGNTAPGSINVGNGVQIGDIQRITDSFVDNLLRDATSTRSETDLELEYMSRLEGLFGVSAEIPSVGSRLSEFFNSLNDLTTNPSSIELRKNVMERAQDLVTTIQSTYNSIADLQKEADTRLTSEIDIVNSLTSQIAELNGLITQRESTGTTAGAERDRRDVIMNKLAEKISYSVIENSDHSVTISLPNGFSLVNGTTSRAINLTDSPSFAAGNLPPSLSGTILRHIVYDYSGGAGTSEIDLTQIMKNGSGSIGALLSLRGYNATSSTNAFQADGIFVEMASRVEAISRQLLIDFNTNYRGPDSETGTPAFVDPSSADLIGNPPTDVFAFFTWAGASATVTDINTNGLPDATDLANAMTANNITSFSGILTLNFTDPRLFAAARDTDTDLTDIIHSYEPGNGENARLLANSQNASLTFTTGNYTQTTTYGGVFSESVTHVGNAKARANLDASVADSNFVTIQGRRDEVSGVSLDEEFTNLIRFQKAYQASARMISIADKLMDQILQLI